MKNKYNILIVGVGGQGLITLLKIISEAAISKGYDIKTSELHGLSQRGGSVEVHISFGEKIYSPLTRQGSADLIIALEAQEAKKACYYASEQTIFLINNFFAPIPGQKLEKKESILKDLEKFSKNAIPIPASEICKKEIGSSVVAGVYLISLASFEKILPIDSSLILKAIKKTVPKKYLDINQRAFKLAEKNSKR